VTARQFVRHAQPNSCPTFRLPEAGAKAQIVAMVKPADGRRQ